MFARIKVVLAIAAVAVLAGCAHPIGITPDLGKLPAPGATPFSAKVGYRITDQDRALEVTTPGGGGDKVRYFPYRDLESGLYMVLSNTFASVARLDGLKDEQAIRAQGIAYVVNPRITTNSSSDSLLTWPPTSFVVELECSIADPAGAEVARTRVTGFGNATFSEFVGDFGLAAKRASTDALGKLAEALGKLEALKQR